MQAVGELSRARDAAEIGRDNDDVFEIAFLQIRGEDGRRSEMINRNVEEALNLTGMQVDRHDARDTRRLHEVRDELRRDRLAAARLAILTRIGVVRHDGRDAVRRRPLAGVRHDEKLHEIVVDRLRGRLNDEDILAANALADHHLRLAVVEMTDVCIAKRHADVRCDLLRELGVGVARHDA